MSFMLKAENAAEWARFYGQTPSIKAAFEEPGVKDSPEQQAMLASALRGVNSLHNVPRQKPCQRLSGICSLK